MSSSAAHGKTGMFHVIDAADLNAERDVFVGLPVETTNKQTFHRVPVRSSCTESLTGDRRLRVQLLPGSTNVVQSCQGLRRLVLRFPMVFVHQIRVFEAGGDGERTNVSMGFALYDNRTGPSPEEQAVMRNIDALAAFLRGTMMRCDKIRRTLKLGPDNMSADQQQVAADMLDLHVARPAAERTDGVAAGRGGARGDDDRGTLPARYCYVKLVPPDPNIPEHYHTYFWTTDGRPLPFKSVLGYQNFHAQPLVEVEDVFVSKAVRSLQLKLRECLVVPPTEQPRQRYSLCFPEKVCTHEEEEPAPTVPTDEEVIITGDKRARSPTSDRDAGEPPAKERCSRSPTPEFDVVAASPPAGHEPVM